MSLFSEFCDIPDQREETVRDMEPTAVKTRLEFLLLKLDALIDKTIGLEGASIELADENIEEDAKG